MSGREKFFTPIGNVVMTFQDADFALTMLLASLLNEEGNVALAFAVPLTIQKKLDVIKSIAPFKIKEQALLDELDEIVNEMVQANERRNGIVHGYWLTSVKEGPIGYYKPVAGRGGLKNFVESKSIEDMNAVIGIIQKAAQHLFSFTGKLHKHGVLKQKNFSFSVKTEKPEK